MKYPIRIEIAISVQNLKQFNKDPHLIGGLPLKEAGRVISYSGGYTIVFPIEVSSNKKYALRCWVRDIGDSKKRYKAIDEYLKQVNLPYFADFNYVEKGILVKGKKWDTIRMAWVEALRFKDYVKQHLRNSTKIRDLAKNFLEMAKCLHQNEIAHGDLQHGNILVKPNGQLMLVDYDSLYVPKLTGFEDCIKGLEGYQHPARFDKNNYTSKKLDYFSEVVIYLSLMAIAQNPKLWNKYKVEGSENFLFTQNDFLRPNSTGIFRELEKMTTEIQKLTTILQQYCKATDINGFIPLEKVLQNIGIENQVEKNKLSHQSAISAASKIIKKMHATTPTSPKVNIDDAAKKIIKKMNKKP